MYDQIYFLGTGHVACKCLEILATSTDKEHIQCLAVEQEEIASTRAICKRQQIPYHFFQQPELGDFLCHVAKKSLIISAHNQYIFPKMVVENPHLTIINFHNAYLPFYRGRNAPTWEIFNQESFGGATWHEVDTTVDTGGIIVQEKVPIAEDETALSLLMKCANTGIHLFKKYVGEFLSGKYELYHPETTGTLFLSKDLPNGGRLDPTWDFDKAYAFLRSMDYEMLNIVPKPQLHKNGNIYEIVEYTIGTIDNKRRTSDTQYCIEDIARGTCIYCHLELIS